MTDGEAGAASFRPDIEGLRAVAVLAVVAFHYGLPVSGGFVGVDVFFVISGYLITGVLLREIRATGTLDVLKFYGRRIRRLLPAALFVTVVILIAGFAVTSPPEMLFAAKAAGSSSLYISNFYFMHLAFDYFSPQMALNPFLHTWTLSVEEQFYLVWPALLIVSMKYVRRENIVWVLLVCAAVSFAVCVVATDVEQPWAFYSSPTRAWEFALGGLATLPEIKDRFLVLRRAKWIAPLSLIALAGACIAINETMAFPGWISAWPVLATVVFLMCESDTWTVTNAAMQRIGRNSYSIYLWHWPLIVLCRDVWVVIPWGVVAGCAVLTFALSEFSYRFIEHPIRSSAFLKQRRGRSIVTGVALTAAGVAAATFSYATAAHFSSKGAQAEFLKASELKSLASRRGCLASVLEEGVRSCTLGDTRAKTAIVLFGDSHADQWSTVLDRIAREHHWRLVTFVRASCSPAEIPVFDIIAHRNYGACERWRASALDAIRKLHPAAAVLSEFSEGYALGVGSVGITKWEAGMERTMRRLRASGISVVYVRSIPVPLSDVPRCLSRAAWHGEPLSQCDVARSTAINPELRRAEMDLLHHETAVTPIDLTAHFCNPAVCEAMRNGQILYKDSHHVADRYSIDTARDFETALTSAVHR